MNRRFLQNVHFPLGKPTIFKVCVTIIVLHFSYIFRHKNPPQNPSGTQSEPYQNRRWHFVVFQHRFLGFWNRFGSLLGVQVGAMFAENASHNFPRPVSEPIVSVLETGIWFCSRLKRVWVGFWRVLGVQVGAMLAENASHNWLRPVSEPIVYVSTTGTGFCSRFWKVWGGFLRAWTDILAVVQ